MTQDTLQAYPKQPRRLLLNHASTLIGFSFLLIFLYVWEAAVYFEYISGFVLPPPTAVVAAFAQLILNGSLLGALATTLGILSAALFLAIVIGVSFGYFLYRNSTWGRAFEPILGAVFASPLPLMFPIFLVLFGRTLYAVIFLATIYGTIPIVMNTRVALLSVPKTLIWVGQSFGASNTIIFWKIIVPAAAPLMFTGIKMGLIYSLLGVVAFEFLTDLGGIGRLLSELNYKFKIPETMALTFATVMLSGLVLFITGWIERKLSNG